MAALDAHPDMLIAWRRLANPTVRLLCFPHAGGAAGAYSSWARSLPATWDVWAVQLPGRGALSATAPYRHLGPMLDGLEEQVCALDTAPLVLFGHSMGATVAFELTRRLRAGGWALPQRLVVSGARPPHLPLREPPMHTLSDADLAATLRHMGGIPDAVWQDKEALPLFLPIIRADFAAAETWKFRAEPALEVPILALAGASDQAVPGAEVDLWRSYTRSSFARHTFAGGHFFLQAQQAQVTALLAQG